MMRPSRMWWQTGCALLLGTAAPLGSAAGCSSDGDTSSHGGWWEAGRGQDGSPVDVGADGMGEEGSALDAWDDAGVVDARRGDAVGETPPPFACELASESPTLDPEVWQHPFAPVAGQGVTLILKSGSTAPTSAPSLVGELANHDGIRSITDYTLVGGSNAFYYVTFSPLAQGENCLLLRHGDDVEVARKIVVPGATPVPKGNGVWKIKSNHQWTCDEEPTWGNFIRAKVLDENGNPVAGAKINIRWTDDVVYSVRPDEEATNWDEHGQPKSMTTNEAGDANMVTPWGEGNRTPIDGKSGMVVFLLSVDGGASDTATEITSALWEETYEHCNYCGKNASNVYGHWSYTVTFQREVSAVQVCEVGIDHAGQEHCPYTHFYHDPDHPSCLPVAP